MPSSWASHNEDSAGLSRWERLLPEFLSGHRRALNVGLHLLTTPLGLLANVSLIYVVAPSLAVGVVVAYTLSLAIVLPPWIWCVTAAVLTALVAATVAWPLGLVTSLVLLAVAYVLQEVAHLLTGEKTLQSTYMGSRTWWLQMSEHAFFLLPLVLAAAFRCEGSIFSFLIPRNMLFSTKLDTRQFAKQLECIRKFAESERLSGCTTTHHWQEELRGDERGAFDALASADAILSMLRRFYSNRYAIDILPGMNEIYVSAPATAVSSDRVFYTPHVDGPLPIYPMAAVCRCILAINDNAHVHTHFPMSGSSYDHPKSFTLSTADAVAFDYHREPHYITSDDQQRSNRRISLKLHYLIYPKRLGPYGRALGRMTTWYNARSRGIFLSTISPSGYLARLKTVALLLCTAMFQLIVRTIGWGNLLYVSACAMLSVLFSDARPMLVGTSFVHYFLYAGVMADGENVSIVRFKRNAMFFTALSFAQLLGCCLYFFQSDLMSLSLIGIAFGLATWATALGINRSYFGAELGHFPPHRVNPLPYRLLTHPMIVGALFGLVGIYLLKPSREHLSWLVPTHIALCVVVLTQTILSSSGTRQTQVGEEFG
jgi:hypothetical protein